MIEGHICSHAYYEELLDEGSDELGLHFMSMCVCGEQILEYSYIQYFPKEKK